MAQMSVEERDAFLRVPRIAKLATLEADGQPTIVPLWFEWDGSVARMFTIQGTPKLRRIENDPRAALSVETGVGETEAWVTIEGTVRLTDEDALPLIRRLAYEYYTPEKARSTLESWEQETRWVVIELTPTRIRSLSPGD